MLGWDTLVFRYVYTFAKSVGLNCKAFSHVQICIIAIGIRGDDTNGPEDEGKDQGANGQHNGGNRVFDVIFLLELLYHLLRRLDIDNIHPIVQTGMGCF